MADTGRVWSTVDVSATAVTGWRLVATGEYESLYFGTAYAYYGTGT